VAKWKKQYRWWGHNLLSTAQRCSECRFAPAAPPRVSLVYLSALPGLVKYDLPAHRRCSSPAEALRAARHRRFASFGRPGPDGPREARRCKLHRRKGEVDVTHKAPARPPMRARRACPRADGATAAHTEQVCSAEGCRTVARRPVLGAPRAAPPARPSHPSCGAAQQASYGPQKASYGPQPAESGAGGGERGSEERAAAAPRMCRPAPRALCCGALRRCVLAPRAALSVR